MRKVTIRKLDRTLEVEVSEDEIRELLGLNSGHIANDSSTRITVTQDAPHNLGGRKATVETWTLISETKGELRGRDTKQSKFQVYRTMNDKLIGIVTSENHRYRYNMGKIEDEKSMISVIGNAVDSIPSKIFSKKMLRDRLPARLTNGHTEKLCLDYFEKVGCIERVVDAVGGTILYAKLVPVRQSKVDGPDSFVVSKASEPSTLTQNT